MSYGAGSATVLRLVAKDVPRGVRAQVRCSGGGCAFSRRSVKRGRQGTVKATALFGKRPLAVGTVIELRFTGRDAIGRVIRFKVRANKQPRKLVGCLAPGARRVSKCPRS